MPKTKRRLWAAYECDYLVATYATQSVDEQAAYLGRSRVGVIIKRGDLVREGRLDMSKRRAYPHFTSAQIEEMQQHVREGLATHVIARKMKRTESSIVTALSDHCATTLTALRADSLVYSLKHFAHLMGISTGTAHRWNAAGFLALQHLQRRHAVIRLTETDIVTFLTNRNHWPRWDASTITDLVWRVRAEQIRASAGGCWMTAPQIAKQHYCSHTTALKYLTHLQVPSLQVGRTFFFWSEDVKGIHFDY